MNKSLVFAPKPKFMIPKIRPSSFSLNEDDFENYSEIIENEENIENIDLKLEEKERVLDDEEEDLSLSFEEEKGRKYCNSIFKTLKKIQKRESNKSLETRDSDD